MQEKRTSVTKCYKYILRGSHGRLYIMGARYDVAQSVEPNSGSQLPVMVIEVAILDNLRVE